MRIQTGEKLNVCRIFAFNHLPGHITINTGEVVHLQRVEKLLDEAKTTYFKMCPRGLVVEASFNLN